MPPPPQPSSILPHVLIPPDSGIVNDDTPPFPMFKFRRTVGWSVNWSLSNPRTVKDLFVINENRRLRSLKKTTPGNKRIIGFKVFRSMRPWVDQELDLWMDYLYI